MFDFGFGELLLLAVIALVVLGPERLPVAARLAGLWIRKARQQWNQVKAELENELADDELRKQLREAQEALRQGTRPVRELHDGLAASAAALARPLSPPALAETHAEPPGGDGRADPAAPAAGEAGPAVDPAQLSLLDTGPATPLGRDGPPADG